MKRTPILLVAAGLFAAAGCSRSAEVVSGGDVAPAATPVVASSNAALPSGANMTVRLNQTLSTESSKVGDTFTASVVTSAEIPTSPSGDCTSKCRLSKMPLVSTVPALPVIVTGSANAPTTAVLSGPNAIIDAPASTVEFPLNFGGMVAQDGQG